MQGCSRDALWKVLTVLMMQVRVRQESDDVKYQILARGEGAEAVQDAAVMRDYFNLETQLGPLSDEWARRDSRFAAIRGFIPGELPFHQFLFWCRAQLVASNQSGDLQPDDACRRHHEVAATYVVLHWYCTEGLRRWHSGARVLRQDPEECLFQFICSSNNHIKRIHGMVERLCRSYGTQLHVRHTPGHHIAVILCIEQISTSHWAKLSISMPSA